MRTDRLQMHVTAMHKMSATPITGPSQIHVLSLSIHADAAVGQGSNTTTVATTAATCGTTVARMTARPLWATQKPRPSAATEIRVPTQESEVLSGHCPPIPACWAIVDALTPSLTRSLPVAHASPTVARADECAKQ
jgi:hypothetical protein